MLLLLAPLLLGGETARQLTPLPAAEAKKLRASFSAALASSDPRDWKPCLGLVETLETKHGRAAVLALVAEGPELPRGEPKPRKVGKKKEEYTRIDQVTVGFAFEHDGDPYRYALDLPQRYDAERRTGLLIDPGHGSGKDQDDRGKADFLPFFRGRVDSAGFADWLVARTEIIEEVGTDGRRGARPEDEVAATFAAFRRDVLTRFAVDPARVYVAGLSQTGFWSWYLGRELADRLAGIVPMGAVTWEVDPALGNLLSLPTFVIHGARDEICKVEPVRATTKRMQELGLPVKYLELADAGHDVGAWSQLAQGLAWVVAQPREPAPKHVMKSLGTLANPWAHWLRVEKLAKETDGRAVTPPLGHVEGRIAGQRITLESRGIEALSLWLSPALLDLDQDLDVSWNGKRAFQGHPPRSARVAVEAALERCDWLFLPEARVELR
jgi:predicted esterase